MAATSGLASGIAFASINVVALRQLSLQYAHSIQGLLIKIFTAKRACIVQTML